MGKKRVQPSGPIIEIIQSYLMECGGRSSLSKIGSVIRKLPRGGKKLSQILRENPQYFLVIHSERELCVELVNRPAGTMPSMQDLLPLPSVSEVPLEVKERVEIDVTTVRRSKRGRGTTSPKEIMDSFQVHEMRDPNELHVLMGTMANYSNNSKKPIFVGIDFRSDSSGGVMPSSTLVDIMIGKSKFTFDCLAFSTLHGPHWLQGLLSHQRLFPMMGNPNQLLEGPFIASYDTNPLADINILDLQIVLEDLFEEPYPEWESILDNLLKRRFGTEQLPPDFYKHRKHIFFHLLWEEMQNKLHVRDIMRLHTATKNRLGIVDARDLSCHIEHVTSPVREVPSNQPLSPPPTLRDIEATERNEADVTMKRRSKRLKSTSLVSNQSLPPPPRDVEETATNETEVSIKRRSKRLKCTSLKEIIDSFEVHEMEDPSELPILMGTMSNYSSNSKKPIFVGIDFRGDSSGGAIPPSTLVDIMIGKSKFTFDCLAFSAVHGPHWLQALLSHQWLFPMIGNPTHLWEGPFMPSYDTNPLAETKVLDSQLVAEYLFLEPYLEWESILDKLLKLRFGTEQLPRDSDKHRKHLFFHVLWEEMQHKLKEQDILLLQTATKNRMVNVNARYQFGFDSGNGYRKYSSTQATLAREHPAHPLHPQHFLDKIPLEENNDFHILMECLPPRLLQYLNPWHPNVERFNQTITEIILDLGQRPYLWADRRRIFFCNTTESVLVEQDDIDHVLDKGQFRFGPDNRAALPGQLHRISAMRDRMGKIYGLTLRFGRHVKGNAGLILDILKGTTMSILILGPPGSGKTTLVREIASVLSEEVANALIVDTSNEIGGDGEKPHPCVGLARRMMVPSLAQQASVMVECVQNHTPHVMIIDEIGRSDEVAAAATIKNRGVRLVASAHGDLRGLVANADLNGLIGGVQAVTLGDGLAMRRASATASKVEKVVNQRVGPAIFDVIIELDRNNQHEWKVITESNEAVDAVLNGDRYSYELRSRNPETFEMSMVRHSEG